MFLSPVTYTEMMALLFNYDHFVDIFILISFSYLLLYCCIVIT